MFQMADGANATAFDSDRQPPPSAAWSSDAWSSDAWSSSAVSADATATIDRLSDAPHLLRSLPAPSVCGLLTELVASPSLFRSVRPPVMAALIDVLCSAASPSSGLLTDLSTAVALTPALADALPPPTTVRLLGGIARADGDLCRLSPAVLAALVRSASSAAALRALGPRDASALVDMCVSDRCALTGSSTADLVRLLAAVSSSPPDLVSAGRAADLLYRVSTLSPSALCSAPTEVDAFLRRPGSLTDTTVLARLTAVVGSSPYALRAVGPAALSGLLAALSGSDVVPSAVPDSAVVGLLAGLSPSPTAADAVPAETLVRLLHAVKSASPRLLCDLPASVRSAYARYLASARVTGALPADAAVRLVDTLTSVPCLLVRLPSDSLGPFVAFVAANVPPPDRVVDLVHGVLPSAWHDVPTVEAAKLLAPLWTPAVSPRLLSGLARSPRLLDAVADAADVADMFAALGSSPPGLLEAAPVRALADVLTHVFAAPGILSKIPTPVLADLLRRQPDVVPAIPAFAIAAFATFLAPDSSGPPSPSDATRSVRLLAEVPRVTEHMTTASLATLLSAATKLPEAVPTDVRIRLIRGVPCPTLCSVPAATFREFVRPLGASAAASAAVLAHPCLLAVLDGLTVTHLLDALSGSPAALRGMSPHALANLTASVSTGLGPSASASAGARVRFLHALSVAAPSALSLVPAPALSSLLEPLKSPSRFGDLTAADVQNLADALIATPQLAVQMTRAALVNLFTAFANAGPATKTVALLAAVHEASPSSVCAVPADVVATLLNSVGSEPALVAMPAERVVTLFTTVSSSPCLMNFAAGPVLDRLLDAVSPSPDDRCRQATLPVVDPYPFLTRLALVPAALRRVAPSAFVAFVCAALFAATEQSAAPSPAVVHVLFTVMRDSRFVHALRPAGVAALLSVLSIAPHASDALTGPAASVLLDAVGSPPALASLPATALHGLVNLLTVFPELLTATPGDSPLLDALSSSPEALGSLPSCALPELLAALSGVSSAFLCTLPTRVVAALFGSAVSASALDAATPASVAALVSTLNRLSCLPTVLSASLLTVFVAHLAAHPYLLAATSRSDVVDFAHNVARPFGLLPLPPCTTAADRSEDSSPSPSIKADPSSQRRHETTPTTPNVILPANDGMGPFPKCTGDVDANKTFC